MSDLGDIFQPCDGCAEFCVACAIEGHGSVVACLPCLDTISEPIQGEPGIRRIRQAFWGASYSIITTRDAEGPHVTCQRCGTVHRYMGVRGVHWKVGELS